MQAVPESKKLENPYGSFSVTYEISDGALQAHRALEIRGGPIPAGEYPEFKSFLENVIQAQDLVLVFADSG